MIDKDEMAKHLLPYAMRMATKAYNKCGIHGLTLEDFQDAAMEGLAYTIRDYRDDTLLSVYGYMWYLIKREFHITILYTCLT